MATIPQIKQSETGKAGLTRQVAEFLKWMENLYGVAWYRNHQALGNRKGRPDFEIILPIKNIILTGDICVDLSGSAFTSLIVYVELKTETGSLSPHQKKERNRIELAGGRYYVCRSLKDVADIFHEFGFKDFTIN